MSSVKKSLGGLLALVMFGTLLSVVGAQPVNALPEGFEASNVITGLRRPTNLEFSPDGRVFIAEQGGLLKVYDDLSDPTPTIAADLRGQVHAVDGRGLLGLALDPAFPDTPDVYVMYAHDAPIGGTAPTYGSASGNQDECGNPPGPGRCVISGRISRLTLDGDVAISETVILEDWCQEWTSHSVGDLRFGPDGSLYASSGEGAFAGQPDWGQRSGRNGCGDPPIPHGGTGQTPAGAEGGALRSQDLRTSGDPAGLSGTVIRIDKNTGLAHPANPNFGNTDENVARVVAYGLRNPYRTTFRPGTGELWVGDVGWNDWEEINLIDSADDDVLNFGWPCYEGPDLGYDIGADICTDLINEGPGAVEQPYYQYMQREAIDPTDDCLNNNGSPSALTFYRGGAYPSAYDGAFFFGDYSRRCVWAMYAGPDGRPDPATAHHILSDIAVSDLERGPGGDIYMLNIFGGGPIGGTVVRLAYPEGSFGPSARLTVDVDQGPVPLNLTFDASASTPSSPDDQLSFDWDLDGDGNFGDASGPVVQHQYDSEGRYSAQVLVSDQNGESATASRLIVAGTPPTVTIDAPSEGTDWIVDDELAFSGSAVSASGDPISVDNLTWDLILHHCETLTDCHTHTIGTIEDVAQGSFFAPEHEYPSYIEINLIATSPSGLSTTESLELYPETSLLTVDGTPAGVSAGFNGKTVITPSVHEVIVGSTNTLSAPSSQLLDGTLLDFNSWSDGGAQTHDVTVTDDLTVTANFSETPVPTILVDDVTVTETTGPRARLRVPVRLSRPHDLPVTVRAAQVAGTASLGSDVVKWNSRTVRFNPGQTEKYVEVLIQGDNIDELDETFSLRFSRPVNAPLPDDLAVVTILDDEATPSLSVKDISTLEGNGSGSKNTNFTVSLSGRSDRPVSVQVATADGTADADADYRPLPPATVVIPPGSTRRQVTVRVLRDNLPEGDETVLLQLADPENAVLADDEAVLTIRDDEASLRIGDATIGEGANGQRTMRFTVRLSKRATTAVTVDWATEDDSAVAPEDYLARSGTLTIPRGRTSAAFTVPVLGDSDPEPDERFTVLLSNPVGASISDPVAVGTIRSDDYQPTIAISDVSKVEAGSTVKLVLTLDGPSSKTVRVRYRTEDGTAQAPADYTAKNFGTVSFGAGATRRTVTIKLRHDRLVEGDETFSVVLSDPTNATIGDGQGVVTIIDND